MGAVENFQRKLFISLIYSSSTQPHSGLDRSRNPVRPSFDIFCFFSRIISPVENQNVQSAFSVHTKARVHTNGGAHLSHPGKLAFCLWKSAARRLAEDGHRCDRRGSTRSAILARNARRTRRRPPCSERAARPRAPVASTIGSPLHEFCRPGIFDFFNTIRQMLPFVTKPSRFTEASPMDPPFPDSQISYRRWRRGGRTTGISRCQIVPLSN
jgi:hypothetical protein